MEAGRRLALAKPPRLAADMTVALVTLKTSSPSFREAEPLGREAVRLSVRYPYPRYEVAARAALARVLGMEERYDEAIASSQKALTLAKANNFELLQQQTEGNLAWLCIELGDNELAEEYLNDALAKATKLGMKRDLVIWHQQRGNIALGRGDAVAAATEYRTALDLATTLKMSRGAPLANLATVALESKNHSGARDYNAQAISAKRDAGDTDGVLRSQILEARIDRETGQVEGAQRALEQVIAATKSRSIRFEAEAELARVAVARNDASTAEQHFQQALATIGDARNDLTTDELKLSFATVSASLQRDYVDFLASAGRSRDALQVAELSRARTLAEGLGKDRDRSDEIEPERIAKSAGVTVLSYWLGPVRSFVFVVTPEGVQHFVLPSANVINASVDAYQKDLTNVRRGSELYATPVRP